MIGLLDDDPAAGFRALVPLGAQILDVYEAGPGRRGRLARRGRPSRAWALGLLDRRDPAGLPGQGANALESLYRLLGLPGLRLCLSRLDRLLAGLALRLHGLPLRRLDGLLARYHPLALLRLLDLRLALWLHRLPLRRLDGLLARYHPLALLRLLALRLHRLPLRGLDGLLLARYHPLSLLRLLALRLHRLPLRGLDGLLARYHLLALLRLLALRLALWLHRLPLSRLDGLLARYHPLAPLPLLVLRLRLLELRLGRRRLGLRLLLLLLLWLGRYRLWLRLLGGWRGRRLLGLRLPWRGRRWRLLRLRLRLWLRGCGLLLRRCLRGRLLRLLLRRLLRAGMLRVLTALGRGRLGNNDGPRRGRGRDAFGAQEPLRQGQRGYRRDRQQGVLSRRSYLQNLRQIPLLDVAAPFDRGARDEAHGHATSHILRPDFDVWNNNATNAVMPASQRSCRQVA
jgi:hypothetical protein